MNKKKFMLSAVLPIALSLILGASLLIYSGTHVMPSQIRAAASAKKSALSARAERLKADNRELADEIEGLEKELGQYREALDNINSQNERLNDYNAQIDEQSAAIDAVNAEIKERSELLASIAELPAETEGSEKKLGEGEYKCPSDIAAGRYEIKGDATVYLYSLANTLSKKENLATLDTHSFRLEIASGEQLKVEGGSVTLTEIKTN